jgi:hypothetical protein
MEMILKKGAVQKAFSNIGKTNGSKPPEGDPNNSFSVAYELFVSKELKSAAEKRYEMAKSAAKLQGVIDEDKISEGCEVTTFISSFFDVSLKQNAGSRTLDKTMLKNNLMKNLNMSEGVAEAFIDAASKPKKGAVNINISLKG